MEPYGNRNALAQAVSGAATAQMQGGGVPHGQPREIGLLDRTRGMVESSVQLRDHLKTLACRIGGMGQSDDPKPPLPDGLPGMYNEIEAALRECHQIVDALHKSL